MKENLIEPSDDPRISIIIAVLNSDKTIQRCLDSVINQTYPHKELIVLDGGSTDTSLSLMGMYMPHIAHFESGPDTGIYNAWNKGLMHCSGDWICFLGADDYLWTEHVLADMAPHLEAAAKAKIAIVYGQVAKVDDLGNVKRIVGMSWPRIKWQIRHGMPIHLPHPGLMHHRNLFERHGSFDESFKIAGDYEFLLRELKDAPAYFVKGLCTAGFSIGGTSERWPMRTNDEVQKARRKNGLKRFSLIRSFVYARAWLRTLFAKLSR